jgi:hypothetical protein
VKVLLAVGHGVKPDGTEDPGAVGGGWTEQTAGDRIVARATDVLRGAGVHVVSEAYRRDPNFVGTAADANRNGVDCVVSVHHDTHTAPEGSFAYHYPSSQQGRRLAEEIIGKISRYGLPTRNAWLGPGRGTADSPVAGRDLYVLQKTTMPAVLVEIGPIGHEMLNEDEELAVYGVAIAQAVAAWGGLQLPAEKPPVTRAVAVTAAASADRNPARMLAAAHVFAYVEPDSSGDGWVQTYPDGRTAQVDDVDYLVGVGGPSQTLVGQVGDGVVVAGKDRDATMFAVVAKMLDREVPRRRPWAA